jgi:hypothetical protein
VTLAEVVVTGSSATKLYLPDSDIDLTILLAPAGTAATGPAAAVPQQPADSDWFVRVNEALCAAAAAGGTGNGRPSATEPAPPPFSVRKVTFINAEVRIVRCTVDSIGVDVSANAALALSAAALIETADRWVGNAHLFKRSVLLIKAWMHMDGADFCSSLGPGERSLLNSGAGGLSSHACSILVLALFNSSNRVIRHPLHALVLFFEEYAEWEWGSVAVTLNGPKHMYFPSQAGLSRPAAPRIFTAARRRPFTTFAACCTPRAALTTAFDARNVNIEDPVAPWNNLGRSVSRKGLGVLTEALKAGRDRVRSILALARQPSSAPRPGFSAPTALRIFFQSTLSWYGRSDGYREDMTTHPLDKGGPSERADRLAPTALPAALPRGVVDLPELTGNAAAFNRSTAFAEMLLGRELNMPLLVELCRRLLLRGAPVPVGELGKMLGEATGNAGLMSCLKDLFTGLKRFLTGHAACRAAGLIVGADHPFNPHVWVADCLTPAGLEAVRAGRPVAECLALKK